MRHRFLVLSLCLTLSAVTPLLPRAADAQQSAADSGVRVHKPRLLLVPEAVVNNSAASQYVQLKSQAATQRVLNTSEPQVRRVRAIAGRLIPQGARFNAKSRDWPWEVNVIESPTVNAFCMPGGKIIVYTGLIDRLQLADDELAAVIGHEISHALLEHGRARMSEQLLSNVGVNLAAAYFGLSDVSTAALGKATQLAVSLPYSRGQETDADLVGIELAARAGFDPRGAVNVWRKMEAIGGSQPPQFLSTHPGHAARIHEIEANLPRVLPLYQAAARSTGAATRQ